MRSACATGGNAWYKKANGCHWTSCLDCDRRWPQWRFEHAMDLRKGGLVTFCSLTCSRKRWCLPLSDDQVKAAGFWLLPPSSSLQRWQDELSKFVEDIRGAQQQGAASAAEQQPPATLTQWRGLPPPRTLFPTKITTDNKAVDIDEDIEPLPAKKARHFEGQALVSHHVVRDDDEESAEHIHQSEPDELHSEEDALGTLPVEEVARNYRNRFRPPGADESSSMW